MSVSEKHIQEINRGNTFQGETIDLGAAMHQGQVLGQAKVRVPLSTLNRQIF